MSTEPHVASTLGRTPDSLIGRDRELTALSGHFRAEARLVSLVGAAGVGKTRLALEHVEQSADDGHAWNVVVDVRGMTDQQLVADALVAALPGVTGLAGGPVAALWERCHGDDVLLVLDDVEVPSAVGGLVTDLLDGYPRLQVVTTGLRPLAIPAEQVVRLSPLEVEGTDGQLSPAELLFAQTAVRASPAFTLGDHNQGEVLAICRAVGGLPLAIVLAAARCGAIPVEVMARQLSHPAGIELLRDRGRDQDDRHASMEAALEWTYGLLSGEERLLLDQLSVFEGSFDLEAALGVTTPPAASSAEMLDRLSGLISLQFVDLDPTDADDPRLTLPRLVRSHASRRLAQSGEEAATRSRHARYFQARCRRPIEPSMVPDVLAALDRSVVDGHVDDALHAAVAAAAGPGWPGTSTLLEDQVDTLVGRADKDATDPVLLARALIRSVSGGWDDVEGVSYAEWTAGRVREALTAARRSGDRAALLEALLLTVNSLPTTMDAPAAFAAVTEGLPLARELGDEAMTARFELYAAMAASVRGDVEATAALAGTALRRARQVGDETTEIHTALLLDRVPDRLRDDDLAVPSLEELLAACERLGNSRLGGSVLSGLADRALEAGDMLAATRSAYRLALVAADWQLTEPLAATVPISVLVQVAAHRGDLREGTRLRAALEKYHSVVTFARTPDSLQRYDAASALLAEHADPADRATWQREGEELPLPLALQDALTYARSVLDASPPAPRPDRTVAAADLTPRETQVLLRLADGATNKEIAADLGITAKTVMHHSAAIYRKLGVRGRGEAAVWALRAGLVTG